MYASSSRPLSTRLVDAALLARPLYHDVASASGSNREAVVVVLVAALGLGVGTFLGWVSAGSPVTGLVAGIILEPVVTLAAWLGASAAAWVVGLRLASPNSRTAGFWSVARALAFAQTPNLVGVLAILPAPYRSGFWLLSRFWLLAASSTAIRESLGLSGGRALVALLASALVYAALLIGIFRALSLVGVDGVMSLSGGIGL